MTTATTDPFMADVEPGIEPRPMYTLTIASRACEVRSLHTNPDDAHSALHDYLVRHDCYHRPTQLRVDHAAYEVLTLTQREPRVVAVATIETHTSTAAPASTAVC